MSPSSARYGDRVLPGYSNAELVKELHASRCEDDLWLFASAELADRGLRSIRAMIQNGRINAKIAKLLSKANPFSLCPDELRCVDGWLGEAVAQGLDKFRRDTVAGEGWLRRPLAGTTHADLTTWVINGMLLRIPDICGRARRAAARGAVEISTSPDELPDLDTRRPGLSDDPADLAVSRDEWERLLQRVRSMPRDLGAVVLMQAITGLSMAECCRRLRLDPHAIGEKLRRWRRSHGGGQHRRPEEPT